MTQSALATRGPRGCGTASPSIRRWMMWTCLVWSATSLYCAQADLDLQWTQYSDAAELPMSGRWRAEMRQKLMALDSSELTPALKMQRTMLLRRLEAEDQAQPPEPEDPLEARIRSYKSMKLEDVLFWSGFSLVMAVCMSMLVPRLPELLNMLGDSARSSRSGPRRRGGASSGGRKAAAAPSQDAAQDSKND
mmetsp:Transcript_68469/g.164418  ORF Transcript_68469/g.164418 Transcript_68469/m.164418 type:complete len:192 (+) Transcript_68469:46-621(+)